MTYNDKDTIKDEAEEKIIAAAASIQQADPGEAFWAGYVPALRKKMEKKKSFLEFLTAPVPVAALGLIAVALIVLPLFLTLGGSKQGNIVTEEQAALLAEIEQHYDEYAAILYDDYKDSNLK